MSLTQIDGKPFTITAVEDSAYNETPGVKITVQNGFAINNEVVSRFHTTRAAIVKTLKSEQLRADLQAGKTIGPVVCIKETAPKNGGNPYFYLADAAKPAE